MSGKWTDLWDDERKKWVRVYVDLPDPAVVGSASTPTAQKDVTLFDPSGKPIEPTPKKRVGF